jgi:nitroreductase
MLVPSCRGGQEAINQSHALRPSGLRGTQRHLVQLVDAALRAPSSHNSQPWRFRLGADAIRVRADPERWLSTIDPDRRELHQSLGAAIANLVIAAQWYGLESQVAAVDAAHGVVDVMLRPGPEPGGEPLFPAILARRTNRRPFDGRRVPTQDLVALGTAASSEGISCLFFDGAVERRRFTELVATSVRAEFESAAHQEALAAWVRSHEATDGLSPDVLGLRGVKRLSIRLLQRPRWLRAMNHVGFSRGVAADARRLAESAPAWGLLVADRRLPWLRIAGGMAFERLHLEATRRNIAVHPMSQPLQLTSYCDELGRLVGLRCEEALMLFRIGHGPRVPQSRRRSVTDVLE